MPAVDATGVDRFFNGTRDVLIIGTQYNIMVREVFCPAKRVNFLT